MNTVDLGFSQILLSLLLIGLCALVSIFLGAKLERKIALAAVRTLIQLFALGYILKIIFEYNHALTFLGVTFFMLLVATWTSYKRPKISYRGMFSSSFFALLLATLTTGTYTLFFTIPQQPWYNIHKSIPLIGMILGNSLTGISLALDRFTSDLVAHRENIEDLLSMGASRLEVVKSYLGDAIFSGMTPILNSMTVVGLVSIPGMMTGQIITGASPLVASKYQIIIMFMIGSCSFIACFTVVLLTFFKFFEKNHKFNEAILEDIL